MWWKDLENDGFATIPQVLGQSEIALLSGNLSDPIRRRTAPVYATLSGILRSLIWLVTSGFSGSRGEFWVVELFLFERHFLTSHPTLTGLWSGTKTRLCHYWSGEMHRAGDLGL
jgi:hypothetical protein